MRPTIRLFVLAAAATAAACGDDPPKSGPATLPAPRTGTPHGPGPAAPRASQPVETPLPNADPLTADASRRVLLEAIDAAVDPTVVREALLALAASAGADTVRAATTKLLEKGEQAGGYADAESAAAALEALCAAGDPDAGARAVALGRSGIERDEIFDGFIAMLAAVQGAAQAEARGLLVRLADDPIFYPEAVAALAPLREPGAAARFHDIAADAEEEGGVRATSAAGLLALGDARADAVLTALVRATDDDLTSFDVMDGLAVAGLPEVLPWIHKIADPVIAEGENCTVEIASLAGAHVDVRRAGNGTKEDLDALRPLLGKDDGLSDDEVIVALWTLGDDSRADAAANILAKYVTGISAAFDEDLGVRLLEAVAVRKAGAKRPFSRVIDAAAVIPIPDDPKRADVAARAWRIRVAAARAHLLSK